MITQLEEQCNASCVPQQSPLLLTCTKTTTTTTTKQEFLICLKRYDEVTAVFFFVCLFVFFFFAKSVPKLTHTQNAPRTLGQVENIKFIFERRGNHVKTQRVELGNRWPNLMVIHLRS